MKTVVTVLCFSLLATARAGAEEADLVLQNGIIWTVDDEMPRAEAIASLRDRIVYVGTNRGVREYISEETRVIDLDGKLVVPGFNDNHVHFESTGRLLYGLNLLDVSDEQGFADRIRDVHERYAPGTWITGGDWSAYETWAEGDVAEAGREVNPDDL
ncbi:MAG: amidohydrolase family protein, partial [Woeseiaceae bacterium]